MTTEFQREQEERRETLLNDKRLREQQQRGATYSSFAEAFADEERGGRYGMDKQPIHTAVTPVYPEQPPTSPFHHDPVPLEPPIDATDCGPTFGIALREPHEVAASIAAQDVPTLEPPFSAQGNCGDPTAPSTKSPGDVESVGSPPFSDDAEGETTE